jgi:hypothetical protein
MPNTDPPALKAMTWLQHWKSAQNPELTINMWAHIKGGYVCQAVCKKFTESW